MKQHKGDCFSAKTALVCSAKIQSRQNTVACGEYSSKYVFRSSRHNSMNPKEGVYFITLRVGSALIVKLTNIGCLSVVR